MKLAVSNDPKEKYIHPLGTKFVGPDAFARQSTGEYWCVMQPLDPDEMRLQEALIGESTPMLESHLRR